MTKLYCMTLLALVCASSISVDAAKYIDKTDIHEKSESKSHENESGNDNAGSHDGDDTRITMA